MRYRTLGDTGLQVSVISLGTWLTDVEGDNPGHPVLDNALAAGVNLFDCADAYDSGAAEVRLGRALADLPRESFALTSKVYFPTGAGANERGLGRKHIRHSIERSLRSLGVDYLDIYFCHRDDPTVSPREVVRTMDQLVRSGQILHYGLSEWSALRTHQAIIAAREEGLTPPSAIQPQYHMLDRHLELELNDLAQEHALGITSFSPLAQGVLSGKYLDGIPTGSRATTQTDGQVRRMLTEDNLARVRGVAELAGELGCSSAALAIAWCLRLPAVTSVITGVSSPDQLTTTLAAADLELDQTICDRIDGLLDNRPEPRRVG